MNKKSKRILITGGAGFIGSHLAELFLRHGHVVIAVDNFITGSKANVRHFSKHKNFKLMQRDITRPISISGRLDAGRTP